MFPQTRINVPLLIVLIIIITFGLVVFISASLGLLARNNSSVSWIIIKQFISLGIGMSFFLFAIRKKYSFWKKNAFYIFLFSIIVTLFVFIPSLGISIGGSVRWISIGPFSIQPAEFLKFGFIIYFAAWLSSIGHKKIGTYKYGILPMILILGIPTIILLAQPDTGILIIIAIAAATMFFVAGGKWKHLFLLLIIALIGLFLLSLMRPYVRDRFLTFFNPEDANPQAQGYQTRQSIIAIASGGITGKGFGQGVKKFNSLPEPIGDSIFAVLAEESGFIGGGIIIFLFLLVSILGLKIAARAPDSFSRLLTVGIVILITVQSFLNIGAMLRVFPLSGIPILFISQGGSALMFALLEVGIILNISKFQTH